VYVNWKNISNSRRKESPRLRGLSADGGGKKLDLEKMNKIRTQFQKSNEKATTQLDTGEGEYNVWGVANTTGMGCLNAFERNPLKIGEDGGGADSALYRESARRDLRSRLPSQSQRRLRGDKTTISEQNKL